MIYSADMTQPFAVQFAPKTIADEVAQNIRTILSTPLGSASFAREMGIDFSIIDEPEPVAQARLIGEITTALAVQEPRAVVEEVLIKTSISDASEGRLAAVVRFSLAEGVG